jgi:hypothetical protein
LRRSRSPSSMLDAGTRSNGGGSSWLRLAPAPVAVESSASTSRPTCAALPSGRQLVFLTTMTFLPGIRGSTMRPRAVVQEERCFAGFPTSSWNTRRLASTSYPYISCGGPRRSGLSTTIGERGPGGHPSWNGWRNARADSHRDGDRLVRVFPFCSSVRGSGRPGTGWLARTSGTIAGQPLLWLTGDAIARRYATISSCSGTTPRGGWRSAPGRYGPAQSEGRHRGARAPRCATRPGTGDLNDRSWGRRCPRRGSWSPWWPPRRPRARCR